MQSREDFRTSDRVRGAAWLGEILVLNAPYDNVLAGSAFAGRSPPRPGTIAFTRFAGGTRGLVAALNCRHRWPWLPICVVLGPNDPLRAYMASAFPVNRWCTFIRNPNSDRNLSTSVVVAVQGRPPPDAGDMAAYVGLRTGSHELATALGEQFERAMTGRTGACTLSEATYSRLFAAHGRYNARDWRAIGSMCAFTGGAEHLWAAPKTWNRRARKYLALPWNTARTIIGWEWVLEVALRTGGYVAPETESRF